MGGTYTAESYAMFVERGPLDHVCLQCIVDFCDELPGQGLWTVNYRGYISLQACFHTFKIVVGGIQWLSKS